jgi:uncharacterized LabA/DUF88 family protein
LFFIWTTLDLLLSKDPRRASVFVDGSNLYHRLRQCGWSTDVDIAEFGRRLAGLRQLVDVFYYNVPPPRTNPPGQIARQRRYYARVGAGKDLIFRMGYLQERKVGGLSVFEEKGVDIDLAVDMLTGAFEDRYDTAILVSSDGDFKPVVQAIQRRGKRVEYVFFPKAQRSNALASTCNVSRRCRRSWVVTFH